MWSWPVQAPYIPCTKSRVPFPLLRSHQSRSEAHISVLQQVQFYGAELLAPHPTPQAGEPPLVAIHVCLFNIFAVTLHTGVRSIQNLRTHYAMVTGIHLLWTKRISDMKSWITESKIFRRIFGHKKERACTWGVNTNDKLNNLIRNKNII
jgi:hypothetical protein